MFREYKSLAAIQSRWPLQGKRAGVLVAVATVLLAVVSQAQVVVTNVEGDIFGDSQLVITGSGFGAKSPAAPVLWDRLTNVQGYLDRNVADGDPLPVRRESGGSSGGPGDCPECPWHDNGSIYGGMTYYNTDTPRTPGGATYHNVGGGIMSDPGTVYDDYLYVSWWFRTSGTFNGVSAKFIRVWHDASGIWEEGRQAWTYNQYFPGMNGSVWTNWGGHTGEFNHMELEMDFRDYDINQYGVETASVNGVEVVSDIRTGTDIAGPMTYVRLMGCDPNIPEYVEGYEFDWTDIYIDTTPARVLVSDSPSFGGPSHTEIQIPVEWEHNRIVVDAIPGEFHQTVTLYLYVIDPDGVPSGAFELGGSVVDLGIPGPPGTVSLSAY